MKTRILFVLMTLVSMVLIAPAQTKPIPGKKPAVGKMAHKKHHAAKKHAKAHKKGAMKKPPVAKGS